MAPAFFKYYSKRNALTGTINLITRDGISIISTQTARVAMFIMRISGSPIVTGTLETK